MSRNPADNMVGTRCGIFSWEWVESTGWGGGGKGPVIIYQLRGAVLGGVMKIILLQMGGGPNFIYESMGGGGSQI